MSPKTKSKSRREAGRRRSPLGGAPEAPAPAGAAPPERKFPRIPTRTSVLVRKLGGKIRGELSTTLVVGRGGCSIVQPDPQAVGSELYLSILVGVDLVEAHVRVVYSRPLEDGNFEIGAEFMEVSKRDEPLLNSLFE
jgi:hypothetical protein